MPQSHVIAYAYPTSPAAEALRRGATGCHTLTIGRRTVACATYAEALQAAQRAGTTPGRWSMDHPANARFLPH